MSSDTEARIAELAAEFATNVRLYGQDRAVRLFAETLAYTEVTCSMLARERDELRAADCAGCQD